MPLIVAMDLWFLEMMGDFLSMRELLNSWDSRKPVFEGHSSVQPTCIGYSGLHLHISAI